MLVNFKHSKTRPSFVSVGSSFTLVYFADSIRLQRHKLELTQDSIGNGVRDIFYSYKEISQASLNHTIIMREAFYLYVRDF